MSDARLACEGRPDSARSSALHFVAEAAAARRRLLLYPSHIGGSVCGRGLSSHPFSTIGFERKHNEALQQEGEDAFVKALLVDMPPPPAGQAKIVAATAADAATRRRERSARPACERWPDAARERLVSLRGVAEPSSAAVGRGAPLCFSLITPGHQRVSELREKMGITGNSLGGRGFEPHHPL